MSIGQFVVKKEKTSYSLPLKKNLVDLTTKTPRSRKKNLSKIMDDSLESLRAKEDMKKLVSISQTISTFEFFCLILIY